MTAPKVLEELRPPELEADGKVEEAEEDCDEGWKEFKVVFILSTKGGRSQSLKRGEE